MKRRCKDDYLVLARMCIEHIDEKPSKFVKKVYAIDQIRNLFSKTIVYNYFLYFKRYLKDGYKVQAMPSSFVEAIDSIRKKACIANNNIQAAKVKQLTYEEIVQQIEDEYEQLKEKAKKIKEEIDKQIFLLTKKSEDLNRYLTEKTNELNEKRDRLIREYFERM